MAGDRWHDGRGGGWLGSRYAKKLGATTIIVLGLLIANLRGYSLSWGFGLGDPHLPRHR